MDHTLFLFDIDGTLLDTGGVGQRAMRTVATQSFGGKLDFGPIRFGGMLDPDIFHEAAGHGGLEDAASHHQRFHDAYLPLLAAELAQIDRSSTLLPGVIDLLDRLEREVSAVLGVVTGNYAAAAPIKLEHAGIATQRFTVTGFGDQAPTRPLLVRHAMDQYAMLHGQPARPERTIVIGDTPRDIDCAKANGCVAVAVATGRFPAEELRTHGADIVLDNLSDPNAILSLL
ncbi:HAD family hydrolase [Phycisphaeraceae bacterium D3-23]